MEWRIAMEKIAAIIILCLAMSVPALAEKVYTNSSLKKYNIYKSQIHNTDNSASQTNDADNKDEAQEKITIVEQKMNWTNSSQDDKFKNYRWQVKVANSYPVIKRVEIEFNLLDQEGSIINSSHKTGNLEANSTYTYNGTGAVESENFPKVVRTSVKLTAR